MNEIRVGIIGFGTVGKGLAEVLLAQQSGWSAHRDVHPPGRHRRPWHHALPERFSHVPLTRDARDLIRDPEIDILVELIGGIEPAKTFVLEAIEAGKHVVTANKALLPGGARHLRGRGRKRRGGRLRGQRRRRHPGDQVPQRGAGGQPHPVDHGHHERHGQLHPHPHDRRGHTLPRCSPRRSGWGLPRPIRATTSRASTRPTSWPSSCPWPTACTSPTTRSPSRVSRASSPWTSNWRASRLPHQAARHQPQPR